MNCRYFMRFIVIKKAKNIRHPEKKPEGEQYGNASLNLCATIKASSKSKRSCIIEI